MLYTLILPNNHFKDKTIHSPEFSSLENHTVFLTLDGRHMFLGVVYQPPASKYFTLNRNKGRFYHDLVSENCGDGKKLWQALNRILSRSNSTVLPSFVDEKSLANRFGSFFIDKIKNI